MVKIGNAVRNEKGGIAGGEIGDQDGKEVRIQNFYVKGWTSVFRAKSAAMAEAIAANMEAACKNDNIGYSQKENRYTLYESLKANGKNMSTARGDCDCSELVRLCCWLAGANLPTKISTSNMLSAFKASGQFEIFGDAAHTQSDAYARRGDIYMRRGHTFVVLEDGQKAGQDDEESDEENLLTGKAHRVIVDGVKQWCNVRSGPSKEDAIIGRAYLNDTFNAYGFVEDWYLVDFNGKPGYIYKDFISEMEE